MGSGEVHEDVYPKIEEEVPAIAKTLKALEGKDPKQVASVPQRFKGEGFDPFDPTGGSTQTQGGMGFEGRPPGMVSGAPPPNMMRPNMGGIRGPASEGLTQPPGTANPESEIPEHCLIRLIDVTVEPGKIYQYRIQVRMANPNYQRGGEVASPGYAQDKELHSDLWFDIPDKVVVPPELVYYVVDQKDYEARDYRGPHVNEPFERTRQIVLQAHKWLETVPLKDDRRNPLLVGEWAIAERIPVYRGEYIGRIERVEFPFWKPTQEGFVVASDSTTRTRHPGIEVNFGFERPDGREALLVDFEGGKQSYERVVSRNDDKVQTQKVDDVGAVEAVFLSPDGRLLSRDSAYDVNEHERTDRLDRVRKRLDEVKNKVKSGGNTGSDKGSPFN
jgi:hypothetical protein